MVGFFDFLPGFGSSSATFDAPLAPEQAFVAIGDIHGRDDLLASILDKIHDTVPDIPVVFVGDYIDRGPDSSAALRRVMKLCKHEPQKFFALKGNHEAMFLEFVDAPAASGLRWLVNGGDKTLESFAVSPPEDGQNPDLLQMASEALIEKAGQDLIDWLRALPLVWQSGNVSVTHAGADPSRPIEPRRGHGMLWGHPEFLRAARQDGIWIVHGHFIVSMAESKAGRIAIDTGAYSTGTLSAAIIEPGNVRFLTT